MNKYYYKNQSFFNIKKLIRLIGLLIFVFGISIVLYVFSPLLIWQLTLAPAFAEQQITVPIPHHNLVTTINLASLVNVSLQKLSGVDFTNAANWYPQYDFKHNAPRENS